MRALKLRCLGSLIARLVALCAPVCMLLALSAADARAQSGALSIATTSLPSGQEWTAYNATLAASGGTTPYSWTLTSGTLPAGLALNAATGAISGTPAATANATSLTFKVTDSSSPKKSKSASLTLTIAGPSGTITAVQRNIFSGLTCAPTCPTETISSTGAGDLLFVAALNTGNGTATANIANISCTPSCGTWVYPGAACQAWSHLSAGEDCAYVLSSSAGAKSITVTMSATSNLSQSLSFREYHSTAGAFGLSGGPSAGLVSACTTCLTPNISVTGNNVIIAGGTPDNGFTAMAAPFGNALIDSYEAIIGDNLNTASGTGATLTQNISGPAAVFTIGFNSPSTLTVTTTSLPSGLVGTAYSATLAASGGTSPYTWSLTSGTLPAGLTLNAATGAITGTPTAMATATALTFTVTDSSSPTQSKSVNLTLTIVAPTALAITTTSLPSGQVGTAYGATLAASGGTSPYTWSLTSGTLPAGLTLNAATGAITGTPTATANATALTFTVTDSSSPTQSKSVSLTLTIAGPSGTITAVQRNIFSGLTCAPTCPTETISSTGAGDLLFVAALNTGNGTATANIANISCTPSCGTWVYPGAACQAWSHLSAGEDCAYVLSSSAGAKSITVTMSATSNLSQSLSFREYHSTAGAFGLSGGPSAGLVSACTTCLTPNISVTGNNVIIAGGTPDNGFTAMAAPFGNALIDSYEAIIGDNLNTASGTGATLTQNISGPAAVFTIGFNSPSTLTVTTTSLPSGLVGTAYSATLAASGGTSPYTWSLTSGTLPAGLTLNAATGAITGTPTAMATATALTFTVTDSSSPTQSKSVNLTLTIVAPTALAITTTSLPSGQVGTAYGATLAASGGTSPYTWSLTSGTLPAGLTLNAATGAITGTPAATANATSLTFTVTDSSSPTQSKSVSLTLTIAGPSGTITAVQRNIFSGLTCAPTCPTETISSTGAGDLLFVAALNTGNGTATANIANISCTPSCGTWVYPGAACQAWSHLSAGEDCAYVLSSSAGAKSITVTMSATSNLSQSLSFREYHSTAGAFGLSGGPSAGLVSACTTCLTPNISVTGNNVIIAGGTPDNGFTAMAAPFGNALIDSYEAIIGDNLNTASGTGATLTQNISGPAAVFTIGFNSPSTLTVTTTSLPSGLVGTAYSATLAASGGTSPYTWSLTSGTLPAGLTLNAATGAITGTPTAMATATALTFTVTDSSSPTQSKSVNLTLTIAPFAISVSLSPRRAGLAITQNLSVTPTTTDSGGVNWSVSGSSCSGAACGTLSSATSLNGVPVTYAAPATAGVYTITASSVTDSSIKATFTVGVTDLAGMTTYHNDLSRDGANTQEYALNTANLTTSTFGKLFSCTVDEAVYAQPLWVPNLTVGSAVHNVIFVATQNDSLYAFDADKNTTPCTPLWHVNLLDSVHGGTTGETSVPSSPSNYLVGGGGGDIMPEVGVTGTPVIDLTTDTLYVVSKSVIASGPTFFQRLHAIDLETGNEKFSGPVNIAATYPGNGDGGTTTTFVAQQENQRPGLALVNGIVYIAWASHEDTTPFYGWVIGYNASSLAQTNVFNVVPNSPSSPMIGSAGYGGIWMSGGAPAADSSGNLYLITANGSFDPTTSDYGDSLLQLSPSLVINQFFTPSDQQSDNNYDNDFGSGGAAILVNLPANGNNPTNLVVGGGKDGALYILNRAATKMGGYGDSNAWQEVQLGNGIFSTGAFWNDNFYIAPINTALLEYTLSQSTAKLSTSSVSNSSETFGRTGATPSVTSMPDNTNGIVWALDNTQYCTEQAPGCGPTVLHAYDATNLSTELWNSTQGSGNSAGNAVKFTVPTVANGKVYVGTRGNNAGGADNSSAIPGELDVYGLLP